MEVEKVKRLDPLYPRACKTCGNTFSHICVDCTYRPPEKRTKFSKLRALAEAYGMGAPMVETLKADLVDDVPDMLDYMSTDNFDQRLSDGFALRMEAGDDNL